jgi:ankyrin repeat protein
MQPQILLPGSVIEVMDYDNEQEKLVKKLYMVIADQIMFDENSNTVNNFIGVKLSTNLLASSHRSSYLLKKKQFDFLSNDSLVLLHTIKYLHKNDVVSVIGNVDYMTRLFVSVRLFGIFSTLYTLFQKKY